MNLVILLAALAQASQPTVGDTIWLYREATVAPGQVARLPEWQLAGDLEALDSPRLIGDTGLIRIAFPLVVWRPGSHEVVLPGPTIIDADGSERRLPAEVATVTVASVLPEVPPDSQLPIRPAAGLVSRPVTSLLPLLLTLLAAVALLMPLWWWWLRRGKPVPAADRDAAERVTPDVEAWAAAGETRAVLTVSVHRLREALEALDHDTLPGLSDEAWAARVTDLRPDTPMDDVSKVVAILKRLRFAPDDPAEALLWYHKAEEFAGRIEQGGNGSEP